jgi:hypothetical protein
MEQAKPEPRELCLGPHDSLASDDHAQTSPTVQLTTASRTKARCMIPYAKITICVRQ